MANMFSSFFHPEDAYKKAEEAARQGYEKAQGYQQPFFQGGVDQYGRLNEATGQLLDPATLQNQWSQGYETSPYAQQLLKQNQASGLDAASAMGLNGSSAALGNIQQGAGNIVAQDRQQFMDDLMKKYMTGIGLGSSLYGTGASAGANLGGQAMSQGENMAGLQYGRYSAPGELFGKLLGGGLSAAAQGAGNYNKTGNMFNAGNNFNAYIPPEAAAAI